MSKSLFPVGISETNKNRIMGLAKTLFPHKKEEEITKEDLSFIIKMDMSTSFNKLTVSAAGTRPTDVKYATNQYFANLEVDLGEIKAAVDDMLKDVPEEELIDRYFELKGTVINMIKVKYEGTENYLRSLIESAMQKDNCPTPGRNA